MYTKKHRMFSASVSLLFRVILDISRIEIELQEERYSRFFSFAKHRAKVTQEESWLSLEELSYSTRF